MKECTCKDLVDITDEKGTTLYECVLYYSTFNFVTFFCFFKF